jgi:hypothetical protein
MDKAEAERLNGKPVFSIDPSGQTFRMSSPDGSCSLSFDAKAAALITTRHSDQQSAIRRTGRLDGTASVRDGMIEVQLHNKTDWELKEVVVGLTLLNERGPLFRSASPARPNRRDFDSEASRHNHAVSPGGDSAAGWDTVFRGALDQDLGPATDWHWALVGAKGVPPAAPVQKLSNRQAGRQLPLSAYQACRTRATG